MTRHHHKNIGIALGCFLLFIIGNAFAVIPAQFIENKGQVHNAAVRFYTPIDMGRLFVKDNGDLVYYLGGQSPSGKPFAWAFQESFLATAGSHAKAATGDLMVGPVATGVEPVSIHRISSAADKKSPRRFQLSSYGELNLGEPFPGIDVRLIARGDQVEKRFYLAPGASVEAITIQLQGVETAGVDASGALRISAGGNSLFFTEPVAFQWIDGEKKTVDAGYWVKGKRYGFQLGAYDKTREVVIDPLLASTYLGGTNTNPAWTGNYDRDIAYAVAAAADSIYVAGVTQSADFPVQLGYDESPDAYGRPDGFVARFSPDLTALLSATFLGTDYFDSVQDMVLDADGTVIVAGQAGYGFPVTPGAYNYQGSEPVGGGFVARLSADLSELVASAVVTPSDYPRKIAVGNGAVYFGGSTNNPNFPITPNAYRSTCCPAGAFGIREYDGFAGKLSSNLRTLLSLTYLGGNVVSDIAVADDSSVYLTDGADTAITGYLSRFDTDLSNLLAQVSYYPGTNSGSSRHYFNAVAAGNGVVVAAGQTYLNDLPVTSGAFDTSCGSDGDCDNSSSSLYIPKPDGFVARYSADLQTLQALTYFGGSDAESIRALALDENGDVYISGETLSSDMPTTANAEQTQCSGGCSETDVFVAKLSGDLSGLLYGSYLGGSDEDTALAVALADVDRLLVSGQTASANFPVTAGAFDTGYAGGSSGTYDSDAFVSLFDTSDNGGTSSSSSSSSSSSGGGTENVLPVADAGADQNVSRFQRVYLDGTNSSDSDGSIVAYQWRQVSGQNVSISNADQAVANFRSPNVRRRQVKTLTFELTVTDDRGGVDTDTVVVTVQR